MAPVNRRSAPAPAPARRNATPARSSGFRGAAGREKMLEEQTRAEARREAASHGSPFRFFCPVGESREVVVVDEAPDFFRYEHNLKDSNGKWTIYTSCINEHANCPVCQNNKDKPAYFAMYLTVIDLTPYTNRDGIEVPWSKKLMVVKTSQQKKIMRLYERHKTMRGMVLNMTRDGDKDAAIGNDIEFVEFMDEDTLSEYVNDYEKDGKRIEIIGSEPFDYEELFPEQTEEMLAALVGGRVNNQASHRKNAGVGSGDDWERPTARRSSRAEPKDDEEDDQEEAPPRRSAPASRNAPARPARSRQQDGDQDGVGEEEEPPQRRGPSARRPAPREEAPAPSLAAQRRALRGNR